MHVFRLSRTRYADTLSGKGAAIKGARWNSPGTELVYTAANRSLAMAEVAVHLKILELARDYLILTINVPDDLKIIDVAVESLPHRWNQYPPYTLSTQRIGDQFVRDAEAALLRLPSAVVKGEFNFAINPAHDDFARIEILSTEPFFFDRRLF